MVTLLTLQAVDSLQLEIWVSESDINYISIGDHASVKPSALPGRPLEAIVESVGVNAHPKTGNFPVKLIVQHAGGGLRRSMTRRAWLVSSRETPVRSSGASRRQTVRDL